jgi:hypothetical protein
MCVVFSVLVSYMRSSPPSNIANQYTEYYTYLVCIPIAANLLHCIRYRIWCPYRTFRLLETTQPSLEIARNYQTYYWKNFGNYYESRHFPIFLENFIKKNFRVSKIKKNGQKSWELDWMSHPRRRKYKWFENSLFTMKSRFGWIKDIE